MIAFISDVHANYPALEAVLADIDALGCDRIWCLGDTTGYGPYVVECLEAVMQRCEVVIAGNHDLAVVGDDRASAEVAPGMYRGGPQAGIWHARAELTTHHLDQLRQLDCSFSHDHIEIHHGSARDPIWEYIRTIDVATEHLRLQKHVLGGVGHTHIPMLCELRDNEVHAVGGQVAADASYVLRPGSKRVFNPGSVGQPRDRDPRAAWALLDKGTLTFKRTSYDIARMREAVRAAGLPEETGERLEIGW